MSISDQFYEHLPLQARLLDTKGLVRHFSDAQQPEFNEFFRLVESQYYLFDPRLTPGAFLDWLGQLVGLGAFGGHWLGTGLKSDWPDFYKREVIARIWDYWSRKGTESAVRDGIDIWLRWKEAQNPHCLIIQLPFGKTATSDPPNWWGYNTLYGDHLNETYVTRKHFGGLDYISRPYSPTYSTLEVDEYRWTYQGASWSTRELLATEVPQVDTHQSHLGPERPWMHFLLNPDEWKLIFPDIYELNPELWNLHANPTLFGWLELPLRQKFRLLKDSQYQTSKTVREWEIDGHRFCDIYRYPVRDAQTVQDVSYVQDFFQSPGWRWRCDWQTAAPGRTQTRIETVTETVVEDGLYPGVQWGDLYGGVFDVVTLEPVYSEGTVEDCFMWWDSFNEFQLWYSPSGTELVPVVAQTVLQGMLPYRVPARIYSRSREILVEEPGYSAPATPWYANYREFLRPVITDRVIPAVGCSPGLQYRFIDYYETELVGGVPAVPATQLLERIDAYSEEVEVQAFWQGFLGHQWQRQWCYLANPFLDLFITLIDASIDTSQLILPQLNGLSDRLYELILSDNLFISTLTLGATPEISTPTISLEQGLNSPTISLTSLAPVEVVDWEDGLTIGEGELIIGTFELDVLLGQQFPALAESQDLPPAISWDETALLVQSVYTGWVSEEDYWQAHVQQQVTETVYHPDDWRLELPAKVALFNWQYFSDGWEWMFGGAPEIPPEEVQVPVYDTVELCNVFKNWSRKILTLIREYEVELPLPEGITILDLYPLLRQVSSYRNWVLVLETREQIYLLNPVTMFWFKRTDKDCQFVDKSQSVDIENGRTRLMLEFAFQPKISTELRAATLILDGKAIETFNFERVESLDLSVDGCFGFRFVAPLKFPSGATSLKEDRIFREVYPQLLTNWSLIEQKHQRLYPETYSPEIPVMCANLTEDSLSDLLVALNARMLTVINELDAIETQGDKHYQHDQVQLSTVWVIPHELGKYPSVTVVDSGGSQVIPDVEYPTLDLAVARFREPISGYAFCN